jgi:SAM-dependent methyltransferase
MSHSHSHTDINWDEQAALLEHAADVFMPFFEQAVSWLCDLQPPKGVERVLDVGSGPGVATFVLATAFGHAEVIAVDGSNALLERAKRRAAELGLAHRVRVLQAELPEDFARLPDADLIWSSNALHHVGDQQDAIDQLCRKLRPHGLLAVAEGGLPSRILPAEIGIGRPGLQARVQAAGEEWFAEMRSGLPGSRTAIDDWQSMLRASGLGSVTSRSFLIDMPAPLDAPAREFVRHQLHDVRDRLGDRLADEDVATLERLQDPDAPDGVLRRPDVYFLSARTVHVGRARG